MTLLPPLPPSLQTPDWVSTGHTQRGSPRCGSPWGGPMRSVTLGPQQTSMWNFGINRNHPHSFLPSHRLAHRASCQALRNEGSISQTWPSTLQSLQSRKETKWGYTGVNELRKQPWGLVLLCQSQAVWLLASRTTCVWRDPHENLFSGITLGSPGDGPLGIQRQNASQPQVTAPQALCNSLAFLSLV